LTNSRLIVITGSSKGIGKYLAQRYCARGYDVIGCSRGESGFHHERYQHYRVNVHDEVGVKAMFEDMRKRHSHLTGLVNNAGIAAMNHALLTPVSTLRNILDTNIVGTFLFCRESARWMARAKTGRIVNFSTVAVPMRLEGEAAYAASKAAIESLTHILAREFSPLGITVNAVGPGPIRTDLTRAVPEEKLAALVERLAVKRLCEFADVENVVDFFLRPESAQVTGQTIYLGGV
jgi:3-oxoacyl-[acyl-carrier protein] reductase